MSRNEFAVSPPSAGPAFRPPSTSLATPGPGGASASSAPTSSADWGDDASWRHVVESMPQIVWITRPDAHHLHFNQQWTDYTGLSVADSVGFGWRPAVHPDDRTHAAILWEQAVAACDTYEVEYRLRRADGTYRWMLARGVPLRDGSGEVTRWFGTCTDIEDLKRAQAQLRRGRTLRRLAGSMARLGGWSVSADTFEVRWSDEIAEILEFPPGGVDDITSTLDLYEPEGRAELEASTVACLFEGVPFDIEVSAETFRGRPIWARIFGEPHRDADGTITHVAAALQDVTAEHETRQRALDLADRLTTTLESITEAFYTVDRDWRFTYLNSRAEEVLQRPAAELLGRVLWEEFPAILDSELEAAYRRAACDNVAAFVDEYRSTVLDRWFQVHAYPSEQGVAVYIRDVTEHHEAVEELRHAYDRIEQANERLEEAARVKDDLLSMASHELRTPLTPILGFTELLERRGENLDDEQRRMVRSVRRNAARMRHLVEDLLVVSRATADALTADTQDVAVRDLVLPVLDELGQGLPEVEVAVGDHRVLADPAHVQHAVANLLTNAAKYGAAPVAVVARPTGTGRMAIEVADHGEGVPPAFRDRMWERFTQKDRGLTRTASGAGLGLAIVRLLAAANGGTVGYRDADPTGAVFVLELPAGSA